MLQLKDLHKEYKTGNLVQKALDGVSLNLRDNEFVAILGPSGSGKTTLLNIIGGLDRYDSGELIINGISTRKYKDRDWDSYRNHTIGFVFQSYNLIPHQTVLANVELALTISGVSKAERRARATAALEQVGLGEQLHKKPHQMSGGQMQRVAIARALVNDPDILLADEPTGALDSDTSIQVMELLREVAKDRLVVMVTHNPELAESYATRIVKLRDGKIRADSNPYEVDENALEAPQHRNMGKASMGFGTALALSFNNLRTKKARTLLTAFAGSIGIIGIALILSLSNGVNQYIRSVEEDTLSEYPLQIESTGFDLTSLMPSASESSSKQTAGGEVGVAEMVTGMFSTLDSNDLASLKEYIDGGESGIDTYARSIEYSYDVEPLIYRQNGSGVRQVHPDKSLTALGLGSDASSSSLISSMMSTNVFYEMPENAELYENQYEVKAGRWPENYNECVLVLTQNGSVSDFLLYTLGLRDTVELDEMIRQFLNDETVTAPSDLHGYSYEEILGITFKLVNSADCYEYDEEYGVWKDKSDNAAYMQTLVEQGEDLTIVGIVQRVDADSAAMLTAGINYPASLTRHVIEQAAASEIVQAQLAHPNINVFTGEPFGEESDSDFDLGSIFSIDEDALNQAFQIDESAFELDFSALESALDADNVSLDLSGLEDMDMDLANMELPDTPEMDLDEVFAQFGKSISAEGIETLTSSLVRGYLRYATKNFKWNPLDTDKYFSEYLQTDEAQQLLAEGMTSIFDIDTLEEQLAATMSNYMAGLMTAYTEQVGQALEAQISAAMEQSMGQLSANIEDGIQQCVAQMMDGMQNAFSFDEAAFGDAIQINMDANDLTELMTAMMTSGTSSCDANLKALGYADLDTPTGIAIYPDSFESKAKIIECLEAYNTACEEAGEAEKVISYTDIVGTLMTSVTSIIDTISYVLVAFVAISLIVSSIMIGVITYISVLERKKEIGILRAIGASKHNISQVFNAETFLIGLGAGCIGIGLTALLLIPGNQIIHVVGGNDAINAVLPINAAVILIALSVVLTLLGGFIPAKKAARADPVAALRSE
jgi:ABC-type lipoprotein export system ATPase subunit